MNASMVDVNPGRQFVVGEDWEHFFADSNTAERTRFVIDSDDRIIAAQVYRDGSWVFAERVDRDDLRDSLVNGNDVSFESADEFGFEVTSTLPGWAVGHG